MADIELVIKLSEEDYKNCIEYDALTSSIYKAIQNGTPLPKGHGRLIDADELKKDMNTITEWNGDVRRIVSERGIDFALTIIEADREEK